MHGLVHLADGAGPAPVFEHLVGDEDGFLGLGDEPAHEVLDAGDAVLSGLLEGFIHLAQLGPLSR